MTDLIKLFSTAFIRETINHHFRIDHFITLIYAYIFFLTFINLNKNKKKTHMTWGSGSEVLVPLDTFDLGPCCATTTFIPHLSLKQKHASQKLCLAQVIHWSSSLLCIIFLFNTTLVQPRLQLEPWSRREKHLHTLHMCSVSMFVWASCYELCAVVQTGGESGIGDGPWGIMFFSGTASSADDSLHWL